jgi:predicted nucleic acid-binding protein
MYLDSAYIAKYYLNERDAEAVRRLIQGAESLVSSEWSLVEVTCAFHRHLRQGHLTTSQYQDLSRAFRKHIREELWILIPLTSRLLSRVGAAMDSLTSHVYLRSGDAVQLITAQDAGESEVWTSDRHMLAAAPHFGLTGRSA